jgi:hypothetical protein
LEALEPPALVDASHMLYSAKTATSAPSTTVGDQVSRQNAVAQWHFRIAALQRLGRDTLEATVGR